MKRKDRAASRGRFTSTLPTSIGVLPSLPCFKAAMRSDGVLELMIYEDIGENWWDGSGVTAKSVKEQIDQAGIYSKILVRINSPGGDAFEGMAIHNLLRSQGKPVEVCVDGIAASAASIIAMCGDVITMGRNAMMMIHDAWTICMGNSEDMTKTADTLDKIDGSIAQTYVDRTKKPLAEIQSLMDAETWMSAQECVDQGFATQLAPAPDDKSENNALAMARKFKALGLMKHVPDNLKAKSTECACDCQNCQDGDCENCSNTACVDPNCEDCPMQSDEKSSAAAKVDAAAVPEAKPITVPAAAIASTETAKTPVSEVEAPIADLKETAGPKESNLSLYEVRWSVLKHRAA